MIAINALVVAIALRDHGYTLRHHGGGWVLKPKHRGFRRQPQYAIDDAVVKLLVKERVIATFTKAVLV